MEQIPAQAVTSIGAYDAKTRLSELLDRVEKGEQIVITRHGKPIARLVPEGGHDKAAAHAAVARFRALRAELAATGVDFSDAEIRALRDEGRR
jgi:prevent-host-death family protein